MARRLATIRPGSSRPFTKNENRILGGLAILATGGLAATALHGTATAATLGTGVRYFGYARYPVGSIGVKLGIRGAPQYLFASKVFAATMLAHGIYEFDRNQALFRQKEYKRLGISLMGPPGSLWLYDKIYNGPAKQSLASSSSPSQQNGGAKGNKTSTKSKKSKSYYLGKTRNWAKGHNPCDKGYRLSRRNNAWHCVKK